VFRILTGDRPTGRLHLGHYFGTLRNRVRLADLGAEVFVLIADYQVLTDRDTAERLDEYVTGLLLDYLAIGLDPARTVIFAHRAVPALNQLLLPFLSLVSVPELNRNPTVKDEIAHSRQAAVSGLMLTYPVHQAADILFCKANLVPVGQDQLPHLELTRAIARRFNERFGPAVFPVPHALLSAAPRRVRAGPRLRAPGAAGRQRAGQRDRGRHAGRGAGSHGDAVLSSVRPACRLSPRHNISGRPAQRRGFFLSAVNDLDQFVVTRPVIMLGLGPVHAIHRLDKARHALDDILCDYDGHEFIWIRGLRLQQVALDNPDFPAHAPMASIGFVSVKLIADKQDSVRHVEFVAHPLCDIHARP
jgi:hypothetical protein